MPELTEEPADTTKELKPVPVQGRWRQLSLLGGTMLVENTEASLISGLFPVIRQSLGVSLGALGVLTAAGRIVGVFAGPFWVWAAQRWSRKGVLVLATGFWGVWGIAAGFAQNFTQLLILITVLAAGYAASGPLTTEILGDLFDSESRGRAVGMLYGVINLAASLFATLKGQLAGVDDGWRWGLWGIGTVNVLFGVALLLWMRDPGRGASEQQLAGLDQQTREAHSKVTSKQVTALFRIPSLVILLVSRLLSGQLLAAAFGVIFLVDVYGFSTQVASVVLFPMGIGFFTGTVLGGFLADWAVRRNPRNGLVIILQAAQFAFATMAFFGTQFDWGGIGVFAVFFALMGLTQGINPVVNRPMIMAVTLPELRGAAFAIYLSLFEAVAIATFSLGAGFLGDAFGLRSVFLWVLVVLVLVNGIFLTLLYRTYATDVACVQRTLEDRRRTALAE
ncbi:MFS transporter [Streptomyces sp. NBC_00264]|uniref:MFS transporter n=1 Tax=unclassified Streptomyces TaxID=2593676 RepID=UPI00224D130C|nr:MULTISPECIES: MFS transporter [unclassified Streptomyces]WTB60402.1 MFS transporter [Streptomyces sp. NBC_00826]MCX5098025.1 MFS transporter [Streptomyces sp. NBC_00439]MCX5166335.1 MFS transporter [Streptomyces sp. NBC_00305]MCX5224852.1 MFS transporter [Streptomyces sp. NBC_00264]WSP52367.1 MFS transporter [Streptomyces sp. NBC_01243]